MKTLLKFIIFISVTILITNLLSYINMWHSGANNKPPSICYVAVKQDSLINFVPYSENIKSDNKNDYLVDNIVIKKGLNKWNLVKSGNLITVTWDNGDVESFFRYRIEDNKIEAISCRYTVPGFGFAAMFYTLVTYLIILVMITIYKYFKK